MQYSNIRRTGKTDNPSINTSIITNANIGIGKQRTEHHLFSNTVLIVFSLLCLIPFLLLLAISISNEGDIIKHGYSLIPKQLDFSAYKFIFQSPKELINAYLITIITTVVGTVLSVLIMALIAYPISRNSYKRRKYVSFFVFFTMLFSGGLVPTYILITQYLHMKDTIWVLIVPGLVNAWHIILLRTFFKTIHESLFEASKIDGASEFRIFYSIVLPLSKPALATVALFGILMRWNDWYNCMLYINNQNLYTLQYLLQRILMNIELLKNMSVIAQALTSQIKIPSETMRMAMAVLVVGPIVFVFPFFQEYFTKGLMVGSIKG